MLAWLGLKSLANWLLSLLISEYVSLGKKSFLSLSFNSRGCIWFKEQHYRLTEKKASSNTRIGPEKPTTRSGCAPSRQNNTPWIHVATISSDTPMSPSVFSPEHIKQTRAPASWIIEHRGRTLEEFRASNLKYLSESEPFITMNLLLNNWSLTGYFKSFKSALDAIN